MIRAYISHLESQRYKITTWRAHEPGGQRRQTTVCLRSFDGKTGGFPAVSQHRADPKNDMPRRLSVTLCVTIFNTGWQAVRNTEEISSYCHQHLKEKKKKRTTVATNLSYCQCEHISTQVADKHAVTAIKKRLNICTVSPLKNQYPMVPQPAVSLYILYIKFLYNVGSSGLNHYNTKSNRCHNKWQKFFGI